VLNLVALSADAWRLMISRQESASMAPKKQDNRVEVDDYRHEEASRTNNPPVGLAHVDNKPPPVRKFAHDPHLDPELGWAGKAERPEFDVEAPSIHVHERMSAEAIVTSAQRRARRSAQPAAAV